MSAMQYKRALTRLDRILRRLRVATDPVDRAQLSTELRDVAETIVGESVRDANRSGMTWREIGHQLKVPFQTLYQRYGRNEGA